MDLAEFELFALNFQFALHKMLIFQHILSEIGLAPLFSNVAFKEPKSNLVSFGREELAFFVIS